MRFWTIIPLFFLLNYSFCGQDEPAPLEISVEPGTINVTCLDNCEIPLVGVTVTVDGEPRDQFVPLSFEAAPGQEYIVELSKGGWTFDPPQMAATISDGEIVDLDFVATPPPHVVLIEDFSNHGCGPCPAADEALWEAVGHRAGTVIPIAWHAPFPLGGDPFFMYNLPVGPGFQTARYSTFYGILTLPNIRVDGESVSTASSSTEILAKVEAALTRPRVVEMSIGKTVNDTGDTLTVDVDGEVVGTPGDGPWRLYVILYETHIEYEAGGEEPQNGQTEYSNTVRHVNGEGSGEIGESVDLTESTFSRSVMFTPDLDDQYLNVDNLRAVAFVQHQQAPFLVLDTVVEEECGGP